MSVPIIFSADDGYKVPLLTAIISLFENASAGTRYEVYVLTDGNLPLETANKIRSITQKYSNHTITFTQVDATIFDEVDLDVAHLTKETYFRLLLAELLPDLNRCIYLDCDTIIMKDLSELFSIDLGRNLIAGVKAASYFFPPDGVIHRIKRLNIPSIEQYVNAGVLVINLEQIRKDNITQKFIAASRSITDTVDQGVINSICYGRIKHLPLKYNAMTKYFDSNSYVAWRGERIYSADELEEARNNPVIIHYADRTKPWHDSSVFWADVWYQYKQKTPFANLDYKPVLKPDTKKFTHEATVEKIKSFKELQGKRIVLWGAGRLGTLYAECLRQLGMDFEVTDKNPEKLGMEVMPGAVVKAWSELKNKTDIVLVSAQNIADKVRSTPDVTVPIYDLPQSVECGKLM